MILSIKPDKVVRKSFSIPRGLLESFENMARKKDLHPNALLIKLMRKETYFDMPLDGIGYVVIPEPCFQAWIDGTNSDTLELIAQEQSSRNFGSLLRLFDGDFEFESVVDTYYEIFGKYSGWYNFVRKTTNDKRYLLRLHHKMGIKWSRYLSSYNHTILEKLCNQIYDCRIDDKVVEFEVSPKRQIGMENFMERQQESV